MIELSGIERHFQVGDQQVQALRDINLTVAAGEYMAIMGPSGSGKSTLLNLLGLLDRADSGSYRFAGDEMSRLDEGQLAAVRRDKIGFVFQAFHLVPRLTAFENVELPLLLAGVAPAERRQRVDRLLAMLQLQDRREHRPDQLSGGQRQRVAIARAMVHQPLLLLADEPTGNLDRHSSEEVVTLLEQLNAQGVTLLVVTHDLALGARARRRLVMSDGAAVEDQQQ